MQGESKRSLLRRNARFDGRLDVLAALKGTDKVFAGYRDAARSAGTANATNQ